MKRLIMNRKSILSILIMIALICGLQGVSYGEGAVTGEVTECSGTRRAWPLEDVVDVTIRGTVTATRSVTNLRLEGSANGSFVDFEFLGDLSAGQSKSFSLTGFIFTRGTGLNCNVEMEWLEVVEPDPPPDPPPDLIVESFEISKSTLSPGEKFHALCDRQEQRRWRCLQHNVAVLPIHSCYHFLQLIQRSAPITLVALGANSTSNESLSFTAPTVPGTYYFGVCIDSVTGENNTANNCSTAVSITVTAPPPVIVKGKMGQIILSEFMFESTGGLNSLPQWIELYNTTNTDINVRGWQLEWYRREPKLLDVTTTFQSDFIVPAKQARIISSMSARNSGERELDNDDGSVYSLLSYHGTELDQNDQRNRNRLIARGGFYLKLLDGDSTLIDRIGTLTRKQDEPTWELPECLIDGVRSSMIRRFDNSTARDGTIRQGWIRAYDTKAQSTRFWYGHRTDIGTPVYRSDDRPLPVELSTFTAHCVDDDVIINWTTESELNNAGFNIYRSESKTGEFRQVNTELIQGAGTTGERNEYTWTDTTTHPRTVYYYQIEDVSHAGVRKQLATVRLRGLVSTTDKMLTKWSDLKRPSTFYSRF